jgi:tRNA pseudouridine55 synthase
MNGVLLVDKPAGITSHDVVSKIKKLTSKKTGHAGTLDPFATGLLIILIGEATKISNLLLNDDKAYEGTAVFGNRTDTLDVTGKVIEEKNASFLKEEDILNAFKSFTGSIEQSPPAYSAIKIKGKKSYELARKGMVVSLPKRKVKIYSLDLISFKQAALPEVFFRVRTSKGTYIRSLVDDIGTSLSTGAYLKSLRRLASGRFMIEDSRPLSDYINNPDLIKNNLIEITNALNLPEVIIKNSAKKAFLNGAQVEERFLISNKLPANQVVKILDADGKILSIQKTDSEKATVLAVFKNESN